MHALFSILWRQSKQPHAVHVQATKPSVVSKLLLPTYSSTLKVFPQLSLLAYSAIGRSDP